MKVVSLFDGISCGRVALQRADIEVSRYVAFEIDQDAINVSAWNWEDIEHRGNVEDADFSEFKGFDMVIGGFPCTDLSIGKNNRQGLKGKHSRLFWEQVRAIKEINPRYFLVENNFRMPKKDEAIITETLGVEPIHINSAKVSAQNRDRLYWTNIPNVNQPEDKGIILADILEDRLAMKYYVSAGKVLNIHPSGRGQNGNVQGVGGKSYCLTTNKGEGQKLIYGVERVGDLGKGSQATRVYSPQGKSVCLTSGGGGQGAKTGLYALPYGAAIRTWQRTKTEGVERFKRPEFRLDGKSNAITTVQTDSMVVEPPLKSYCVTASYGRTHISDIAKSRKTQIFEKGNSGAPLFLVENGLLFYKDREIPVKISDGLYAIRKLTPVECERLQTLPDGYTEMVSDTQRYRQLGNGWTVDVIAHIFNHIHLDNLL